MAEGTRARTERRDFSQASPSLRVMVSSDFQASPVGTRREGVVRVSEAET